MQIRGKEQSNGSTGTDSADIVCNAYSADTYQQPLQQKE